MCTEMCQKSICDAQSLLQTRFLLLSTSQHYKKNQHSMEKLGKVKTQFPFEVRQLFLLFKTA